MSSRWIDAPITSGTRIRAIHINQLRSFVNSLRGDVNLPPVPWIDGPSVSSQTPIRAGHFTQLRAAIQEVWIAHSQGNLPDWTYGSPPVADSSRPISHQDMNDLRNWIDGVDPPLRPQGITSFSYAPNGDSVIQANWVSDITNMGTALTGPLRIRSKIVASTDNTINHARYAQAFDLYAAAGMQGFGTLNTEFHLGAYGSNAYADAFATKAKVLAANMEDHNLRNLFVWNEPNDTGPDGAPLTSQAFAYLCHKTYSEIKSLNLGTLVYMGGILWPLGIVPPTQATQAVIDYLNPVYQAVTANGWGIPWDAVNVHVHHWNFTFTDMQNLRARIDEVFSPSDRRPVVVGEWGLEQNEANQSRMTSTYNNIRSFFDEMWYFQHPNRDNGNVCGQSSPKQDWGTSRWSQNAGFQIPDESYHCPPWAMLHSAFNTP